MAYEAGVATVEVTNDTEGLIERGQYVFLPNVTKTVKIARSDLKLLTSREGLAVRELEQDPEVLDKPFSFVKDQDQQVQNRSAGTFDDWTKPTAVESAALPALKHGRMNELRLETGANERAIELGVDLFSVSGTGEEGLVTIADVEAAYGKEIPVIANQYYGGQYDGGGAIPQMALEESDTDDAGYPNPPLSITPSIEPGQEDEAAYRELGGKMVEPTAKQAGGAWARFAEDPDAPVSDVGADQDIHSPLEERMGRANVSRDEPVAPTPKSNDGPYATDGAKEYAEEQGVNLENVEGTGTGGRITKEDVKNYKSNQAEE